MPNFTMFFKEATDKNGETYYRAQTRSGKMKAQLFPTTKDSEFHYTMSIQMPKKRRSYRRSYNQGGGMNAMMKGFMMGMNKK
jgi:hypothetical protein